MSLNQSNQRSGASQDVRNQLMLLLSRSGLPKKLIDRCLHDVDGSPHYQRVASLQHLTTVAPNSSYWGTSCACCCYDGLLIEHGKLGKLKDNEEFVFLAPGYHKISTFGQEYLGDVVTTVYNVAVIHGSAGFVTITEGHIGVLLVGAEYRLLSPGTYQWNSSSVRFQESVDVTRTVARLGPFSLITIPDGMVSITYHNGDLRVLGHREGGEGTVAPAASPTTTAAASSSSPKQDVSNPLVVAGKANFDDGAAAQSIASGLAQRTFFLDDPKWLHSCFLSLKTQTDRLEGNDLLSKDNVEIIMVAMSQWRICNPVLAILECADDMETIRTKVDALVRATIARIVAGTAIGHNVSGASASPAVQGRPVVNADGVQQPQHEEADLSHLMQSDQAILHMKELTKNLFQQGIEVVGIFVPEKRMKNDDIRSEVARQAVIGIKAEAERAAADAKAYATITNARAEAEAISELARAHSEAGKRLGAPHDTAARMALSEITAKALKDAKVTLFSGAPDKMPFLFSPETA